MKRNHLVGLVLATFGVAGALLLFPSDKTAGAADKPEHADVVVQDQVSDSPEGKDESAHRKSCTGPTEAPNFTTYSLGTSLGGHELMGALRRCDDPDPPPAVKDLVPADAPRANFVSYVYGFCEPASDAGCAPPVEIQTWPSCERSEGDIHGPWGEESAGQQRGVPATLYEAGHRLELYTEGSTIVIFADDAALLEEAVRAVQPQPEKQSPGRVDQADPEELDDLPPATDATKKGDARCA